MQEKPKRCSECYSNTVWFRWTCKGNKRWSRNIFEEGNWNENKLMDFFCLFNSKKVSVNKLYTVLVLLQLIIVINWFLQMFAFIYSIFWRVNRYTIILIPMIKWDLQLLIVLMVYSMLKVVQTILTGYQASKIVLKLVFISVLCFCFLNDTLTNS